MDHSRRSAPAIGYGIRAVRHFDQIIRDGTGGDHRQWLRYGNPWEIARRK
jgi:glucan phosphorylase